jgi:hypothetical protein
MSAVRMCDTCHAIFSENDPDWTTVAGARRIRDTRTGEVRNVQMALDECGKCTSSRLGPAEPIVPAVEGRYDERYTRQLEKEVTNGD